MDKTDVSVGFVLDRLSQHLDMLAGQIHTTEEALGKVLRCDVSELKGSVTRLQSLDYLRQSLEDCALLSLLLSKYPTQTKAGKINAEELGRKLRLETTRELLSTTTEEKPIVGDVQLF